VATWVPDTFCSFYFVKNHRSVNNSTVTEVRENFSTDLEFLELKKLCMFD
jgi:hypothetical protein